MEGDSPADDSPADDSPAGDSPAGDSPAGESEKTFTQAQVNDIVQKRVKGEKLEKQKLIDQLGTLKSNSDLTIAAKDSLAQQIEALETSMLTEKEQTVKATKAATQKYDKDTKMLTEDRDLWKKRFHGSSITQALADAAVEHGAENVSQIQMMFSGATENVQGKDEQGNPTEDFVPTLTFTGLNAEKKQESFSLPVKEALAKIREDGLNSNLFKHKSKSGTGDPPKGGAGGVEGQFNPNKPPERKDYSTQEEWATAYDAWRKKSQEGKSKFQQR
jgi:hypothetical protein